MNKNKISSVSTYEKGYKCLQTVYEGNVIIYELDFKYLALIECPVIKICKDVDLDPSDYITTTIKLLMDRNKNYDDLVPMPAVI